MMGVYDWLGHGSYRARLSRSRFDPRVFARTLPSFVRQCSPCPMGSLGLLSAVSDSVRGRLLS